MHSSIVIVFKLSPEKFSSSAVLILFFDIKPFIPSYPVITAGTFIAIASSTHLSTPNNKSAFSRYSLILFLAPNILACPLVSKLSFSKYFSSVSSFSPSPIILKVALLLFFNIFLNISTPLNIVKSFSSLILEII